MHSSFDEFHFPITVYFAMLNFRTTKCVRVPGHKSFVRQSHIRSQMPAFDFYFIYRFKSIVDPTLPSPPLYAITIVRRMQAHEVTWPTVDHLDLRQTANPQLDELFDSVPDRLAQPIASQRCLYIPSEARSTREKICPPPLTFHAHLLQ